MFEGKLGDLLHKAKEMGETMKNMQTELASREFEVSVGGEMVRMRFNGQGDALAIHIAPEIINSDDPQMLEDLVLSAVNEGIRKGQKMKADEMSKMTGGIKIPGINL